MFVGWQAVCVVCDVRVCVRVMSWHGRDASSVCMCAGESGLVGTQPTHTPRLHTGLACTARSCRDVRVCVRVSV